ncbi:hypothetical protein FSP39_002679 [Pinctada imbricata]|uniref:C-type lectin domain-containing protein n=1 Tax=Pinctada imbricata TaxID=66713 RepID=A0AA89C4Y3_PINIB|nr:hypothetical protein FSP39_002679 [Pinctada imbricata]
METRRQSQLEIKIKECTSLVKGCRLVKYHAECLFGYSRITFNKGGDLQQHQVAAPTAKPQNTQCKNTKQTSTKRDAQGTRNVNAQHRNIKHKGLHRNQRDQWATGADLGRPSATEIAEVVGLQGFWLGATDDQQEGHWIWIKDREPVDYSDWAPGEPNNKDSEENCLEYFAEQSFKWNDAPCRLKRRFICEEALNI